MYRVALNTAITHFRKDKQRGNAVSILEIDIPDIQEHDETEERMKQLFKAIDTLDKIDKSVILLFLDEKSYEEISEITGLSKSNVGVKLNRIKAKLSTKINR